MRACRLDRATQGVGQRHRGDASDNLLRLVLGQRSAVREADIGHTLNGRQFRPQALALSVFRQPQLAGDQAVDKLSVADDRRHGAGP